MVKKINIRQIAKELDISPSGVSLALNNKPGISEERRQQVLEHCMNVGYDVLRHSRRGAIRGDISFLYTNWPREGWESTQAASIPAEIIEVQELAERHGHHFAINFSTIEDVRNQRLPRIFEKNLAGILVAGCYDPNYVHLLADQGIPVVLHAFEVFNPTLDCVISDDFQGTREAIHYLIERGHRRIGMLAGFTAHPGNHLRTVAYRDALREAQIAVNPTLIVEDIADANNMVTGYEGAMRLLKACNGDLDAIFCITDDLATACLKAIKDFGMRVPEDISLMGYDNKSWVQHLDPPLTTVRWDDLSMLRVATLRLLELIDPKTEEINRHPRKIVLPAEVIERESVADRRAVKVK